MSVVGTIKKGVYLIEDSLLVSVLLLMIFSAVLQIVLRNFFDTSIIWLDPALKIAVLWLGMIGAMVAARRADHIAINLIQEKVPRHVGRIIFALSALFTSVVCFIAAYHCYRFLLEEKMYPYPAFSLTNPFCEGMDFECQIEVMTWHCQVILPVAFAVIGIRYLINIVWYTGHHLAPSEGDV